jgi:tyrosyl-tRNA synthetase
LGWKIPISVHHHLLPGLSEPISVKSNDDKMHGKNLDDSKVFSKMSKSNPSGSILIHDSEQEITNKINKAYCPPKLSDGNPILEIIQYVIFHETDEFIIERPAKFGGNISYCQFVELKKDYENDKIHPKDLKMATSKYLNEIIKPIRSYLDDFLPDSI